MGSASFTVGDDASGGVRLDRYVVRLEGIPSRSQLKSRGFDATVNGVIAKPSRCLYPGDTVALSWDEPPPATLIPEDLPLPIIYEDGRVLVVDKPQGLVVHPGAGNPSGTLANAVLFRSSMKGTQADGGEGAAGEAGVAPPIPGDPYRGAPGSATGRALRTGIVHRLDKDTSGVIIAAYDERSLAFLAEQFKARTTRKIYLAIVSPPPREDAGRVEGTLARDPRNRKRFFLSGGSGKSSLTFYRVLRRFGAYALVALKPRTGRTHQLRVHMRSIGSPILGDPIYGRKDRRFPEVTLMLHAYRLRITLPGAQGPSTFVAPMPERFRRVLRTLAAEEGARG